MKRPQNPPVNCSLLQEALNGLDITGHNAGSDKDTMAGVMDILIDISSRLEATEQGMQELKAAKAEVPERAQSVSTTWPTACAGKGHSCQ